MIDDYSISAVVAYDRQELDLSLETGEAPVYDLGAGAGVFDGLPGALAVNLLDTERNDTSMPLVAGGGAGGTWLLTLFHDRAPHMSPRMPATATVFTGPDPASHAAAMTTWDVRRSPFRRRPADLAPFMQTVFAPRTRPGAALAGESLPLVEAERPLALRGDGWIAWAAVVAALVLLLIALLA